MTEKKPLHHGGLGTLVELLATQTLRLVQPCCRLTNSGNISIPNATFTNLTFNTELEDSDTMHDLVTNTDRITFKTAGFYNVFSSVRFDASSAGYRLIGIYLNNATFIAADGRVPIPAPDQTDMGVTTGRRFAVNDFVTLRLYHTAGAALNCLAYSEFTPIFGAFRVSS